MKRIVLTLIVIISGYQVYSQSSFWNINYEVSFPTGETGDFIGKSSFRGGAIEGRYLINDYVSVGGLLSWEAFFEKLDYETYHTGNIDISGVQVRYLNVIPLLVTGHYYLGDFTSPTPYVGLGTGGYKIEERYQMGLITIVDDNWHFGFTPEVGVFIPASTDMGLNISARYTNAFKSNDSINYSYLSLSIGLTFLGY